MLASLLDLLRCPFCGTALEIVENSALRRTGDTIESGVLGCQCCAFPIIDGIPALIADDPTRNAMHLMEAGRHDEALAIMLGLDEGRSRAFRSLMDRPAPATYREALEVLSPDAEGTYFVYRFSDPTFVMAEAVLQALAAPPQRLARVLDLCGGSGHLTRALVISGATTPVLADVYYWKLWLAARFVVPDCQPVCCDANHPLPFVRETFSMVVLADAFPYIWHKRLLADEMMRVTTPEGLVVMPHLHSSLGFNFSAGMTLTPEAYRHLFASRQPRLFPDSSLFRGIVERREVDLSTPASSAELGDEPSLTLVAGGSQDAFTRHPLADSSRVSGELRINPLYKVEPHEGSTHLTLAFPTPEYEEEFGECRRYLPESLTLDVDMTGVLSPDLFGARYHDLRRRRVLLDVPKGYV